MKEVILIDGGLECELMNLGYKIDSNNTRLWTGSVLYNSPETLKQAHKNFLKNGAQVITTASYQLSIDVLKEELNCSVDEAKDMIRKSVKIAKEAVESEEQNCERKGLIAGSIGPYGASLCDLSEYSGSYAKNLTIEFLIKWHKARFECLIEEGCDLIAFETIPCIKEASALIELLSQYPTVKAWLSFSCKDNEHICNGDKFKDAYELFNNNSQLVAIGVNCTEAEFVSGLLRSVQKEDVSTPFIVYPNYKDYVWDKDKNKYVPDVDDSAWFNNGYITEWIDLGAKYIGGCCNVNSDNIGTIKSIIDKHKVE